MDRIGEHGVLDRARDAGPSTKPSNHRSRGAITTAAVIAAVVLAAGTTFGALAREASTPPDAAPGPMADPLHIAVYAAFPMPVLVAWPEPQETAGVAAGTMTEPRRLIVEAGDLWFAPNEITIRADEPTVLVLSGVGATAHNLMVDVLGLQLHVGPGTESEVSLSDLPPGTYEYYCSIFGHRRGGMFGTLTIE